MLLKLVQVNFCFYKVNVSLKADIEVMAMHYDKLVTVTLLH